MFYIIIILIIFIAVTGSIRNKLERDGKINPQETTMIKTVYISGIPIFTNGAKVNLQILPEELKITQDELISASLNYSKIIDISKQYLPETVEYSSLEYSQGDYFAPGAKAQLEIRKVGCLQISYYDNNNIEQKLNFSLTSNYISFTKSLKQRITPSHAIHAEL